MKTSTTGINMICGFESLRLEAYDDGVGVWTIGYGTTVINGTEVKKAILAPSSKPNHIWPKI